MSAESKKPITENDDSTLASRENVRESAALQANFEQLIAHLPKDSLAAKLVTAYATPSETTPADAVAKVAATRLDELKQSHDDTEDQKD